MGKITNLEQLAQTASAAKTFTSGLVAELAEAANRDIAAVRAAVEAAATREQVNGAIADALGAAEAALAEV